MVEAAGIEPASALCSAEALHAYFLENTLSASPETRQLKRSVAKRFKCWPQPGRYRVSKKGLATQTARKETGGTEGWG